MSAIEGTFVNSVIFRDTDKEKKTQVGTVIGSTNSACVQQDTMVKRIYELRMWMSRSVGQDKSGYVVSNSLM
jgi:hypothetical protein